jgi:glycosyltransferase involved in cell wall biosynthesis
MESRPRTFLIHPPLEHQQAGPLTFAGHLKAYLESRGFRCREQVDEGLGAMIVFVKAPLRLLLRARRLGIPILLRLDGVYYPRKHGYLNREYFRVNFRVWYIRKWLCDRIIYQSRFSKDMLDTLLGATSKPWQVIHNGIAGPSEPPPGADGAVSGQGPIRFVATGRFRGDDMLPATVRALDLCSGRFDFTLDVYGSVEEKDRGWLERPYVRAHGKVPNERLRTVLPGYDALIFTQTSPSCPNVVVEAMAAGLPVLAYDTGSVKELLTFNRDLLAPTPARILHGSGDFDPGNLSGILVHFAGNRGIYREEAQRHCGDLAEGRTLDLYLKALEQAIRVSPKRQ